MSATAHRALPFPAGADVPDIPLWLEALADALDFDLFLITDDPRPAAGTLGRLHLLAGVLSFDTGAAWLTLPAGGPFLPTAGGALTGPLDLAAHELAGAIVVEDRHKVTTVAAAGAARTLDAAVSPLFDVTLDQNVTFTFAGVDGDKFTLILRQPVALKTVAWPATVDWPDAAVPTQVANTAVRYEFVRVAGRWIAFVSHEIATSGGRSQSKVKNADESVTSSTTLQDDDDLFLALETNTDYAFVAALRVSIPAAADFKLAIDGPAGSTLVWRAIWGDDSSGTPIAVPTNAWVTGLATVQAFLVGSGTRDAVIFIRGSIRTAGAAGNLIFKWAQNTSNGSAVTMNAGSSLATIKEG